ncbi:hypothetical protein [Peribacillus sp. SI8-4]|uniref:hypothetical protein n=1 Tax=Peribacillus sp. SI8-4 TaxID=3048009 RepID=UPI002555F03C|nr:hypothetical protein [Peribacillus sp. SI8-4]
MRELSKRVMGLGAFLLLLMFGVCAEAEASTMAANIKVNAVNKGALASTKDKKVYRVVIPEAGVVTLSIKRNAKASWEGTIQNNKGFNYTYIYTSSQTGGPDFEEVQVGLPKGTYTITISDDGAASKVPFQFSVKHTKDDHFEKEANDTAAAANGIRLNETYKGVISTSDDHDAFQFTVPQNGKVMLSIKQRLETNWHGRIQDRSGKKYGELYTSEKSVITTDLKKGSYYLIMENAEDSIDVPYSFTISDTSPSLRAARIVVSNETGKTDVIKLCDLKKGTIIKVYDAMSRGKMLASGTATGASMNLKVKQLGKKAGSIYVSATQLPLRESGLVARSYQGEISPSLKKSQVKVANNKGKADLVKVSGLTKHDVIKVYSVKGAVLAKTTSKGKRANVSIKQLGTKAGKVIMTVTKNGQRESARLTISFSKEK